MYVCIYVWMDVSITYTKILSKVSGYLHKPFPCRHINYCTSHNMLKCGTKVIHAILHQHQCNSTPTAPTPPNSLAHSCFHKLRHFVIHLLTQSLQPFKMYYLFHLTLLLSIFCFPHHYQMAFYCSPTEKKRGLLEALFL